MFEEFDDYDEYDFFDELGIGMNLLNTGMRTTLLHQAIYRNDISRVEKYLRNGIDVNMPDAQYTTPLQVAVSGLSVNEDIVHLLLQHGADVTGRPDIHGNALTHAAYGSPRIMEILLDHASTQQNFSLKSANNALCKASENGKLEMIQLLLARGVSPNAEGTGDYGSALESAAHGGNEDAVRVLLDAGADVNYRGGYHGSAIQAAARYGRVNIVNMLLQAGADVNILGGCYANALASAIKRHHPQVVEVLLRAGAKPVEEEEISSSSSDI